MAASNQDKSLERLEREAENNRAALVSTVDALRETVLDEVTEMRRKVSVDNIKNELSGYARDTGTAWYETLQRNVRANPLRSVAIGAGLSLPLWRMVRNVPAPILMIGAGIALTRPNMRDAASGALDNAADRLAAVKDRLGSSADAVTGQAQDIVSDTGGRVAARANDAWSSARTSTKDAAANLSDRAGDIADTAARLKAQASDAATSALQAGSERVSAARDATGSAIGQAQTSAVDLFRSNPLAVAGAGLALGALLAALIPSTRAEGQLLERVAPDLKQKAGDLVDQGYDLASQAAGDLYDGVAGRAKDQGLSPEGVQSAADDLGHKVGAVVDAALGRESDTANPADHKHNA